MGVGMPLPPCASFSFGVDLKIKLLIQLFSYAAIYISICI